MFIVRANLVMLGVIGNICAMQFLQMLFSGFHFDAADPLFLLCMCAKKDEDRGS